MGQSAYSLVDEPSVVRVVPGIHLSSGFATTTKLTAASELVPLIQQQLDRRFTGELVLFGASRGRVCLYEGTIAWVCHEGHPEHLGDVFRRELGVSKQSLDDALAYCKASGRRLAEGMLDLGLMQVDELRDCLLRHSRRQFSSLLSKPGPFGVKLEPKTHRYDTALTYRLQELQPEPIAVDDRDFDFLESLLHDCCERIPGLYAASLVETQTGEVLASFAPNDDDDDDLQLLLGLCCAGMRRLVENRVGASIKDHSSCVLMTCRKATIIVRGLAWRPELSLIVGTTGEAGYLISVTQDVAHWRPKAN